jgi:hypothetical protein
MCDLSRAAQRSAHELLTDSGGTDITIPQDIQKPNLLLQEPGEAPALCVCWAPDEAAPRSQSGSAVRYSTAGGVCDAARAKTGASAARDLLHLRFLD